MNIKQVILAAILAMPFTVSATPEISQFEKDLALSAEQKVKLDAIFKAQQDKLRAISEEANAQVKEVLTAEQISKWEAMRQQLLEKKREMIRQHQAKP